MTRASAYLLACLIPLAGCGALDWFDSAEPPLPGDRIAVRKASGSGLTVDAPGVQVSLPAPVANTDWPQAGGSAQRNIGHVAAPAALSPAWTAKTGTGGGSSGRIVSPPVASGRPGLHPRRGRDRLGLRRGQRRAGSGVDQPDARVREYHRRLSAAASPMPTRRRSLSRTASAGSPRCRRPAGEAPLGRAPRRAQPRRTRRLRAAASSPSPATTSIVAVDAGSRARSRGREQGLDQAAGMLGGAAPAASGCCRSIAPFSSGELNAYLTANRFRTAGLGRRPDRDRAAATGLAVIERRRGATP